MARIEGRPVISAQVVIVLSEQEAGALDALAGYGVDAFLETFYEKMGSAYLKPYEAGLRSLFESVHGGSCSVANVLDRARDARKVFNGEASINNG
jgi:hypothetical protein